MDGSQVDGLLRQLGSREPRGVWARFLDLYSPLLLEVVRLYEHDEDAVGNCFLLICGQLSSESFRRRALPA
jgi:hypothetical protein